MPLFKPIVPMVRPTDLANQENGSVASSLLTPCGVKSGYSPFPILNMHHLASRAMKAMMVHARRDLPDHDVRATGAGRTYAQQVMIFDGVAYNSGRYLPESKWSEYPASKWVSPADIRGPWKGERWKRKAGTAMAAVPGTSNHGWWLAIDFSEEYDGNPFTVEGITETFTRWLIANAEQYGYSAEAQSEDWHWRYVAGDNVPQAVLNYEQPAPAPGPAPVPNPTPIPPVQEDDMKLTVMVMTNTVPPTTFLGYAEPHPDGIHKKFWKVLWIDGNDPQAMKMLNDQIAGGALIERVGEHVSVSLFYENDRLPASVHSDGSPWRKDQWGFAPNL